MRTILVVDDESNMRFLLQMVLETEGFEVTVAQHGAAALDCLTKEKPDLVVTDLMMPVMSGRELIDRLRSDPETATIPIVVLTANVDAAVEGADTVLRKPFDIDDLGRAVRALGRKDAR